MVYSTCSLAQEQNECVVSWLLKEYGASVEIVPVLGSMLEDKKSFGGSLVEEPEESQWMEMSKNNIVVGGIPGTVRFHPSIQNEGIGGSSGFFLAKLRKRKAPS
jgi:tRNA and rRNA cytosine-C5-methylases